jgi:SAM-dependent methyltransferase
MPMPGFDEMAASFDRGVKFLEPVTDALLGHLPPIPGDGEVLDIACGTGEPGLTLLRRSPELKLLGVDSSAAMVDVARLFQPAIADLDGHHLSAARDRFAELLAEYRAPDGSYTLPYACRLIRGRR